MKQFLRFCLLMAVFCCSSGLYAQCGAGQTEISFLVDTNPGSFDGEISWGVSPDPVGTPDGSVIGANTTGVETTGAGCGELPEDGTVTYLMCLDNSTTYTFSFYDDYGDGWNGNIYTFTVVDYVDDPTVNSVGYSIFDAPNDPGSGGDFSTDCNGHSIEGTFSFLSGDGILAGGCTDVCASNYDPNALVDDGSCLGDASPNLCSLAVPVPIDGTDNTFDSVCGNNAGTGIAWDASCTGTYAGGDMWFSFETSVGSSGSVTLQAVSAPFSTFVYGVYADCSATNPIFCGTTSGGSTSPPLLAGLDAETTYFLRVFDWGNDQNGEFVFNLSELDCDPSTPTTCAAAIEIPTDGTDVVFDSNCASATVAAPVWDADCTGGYNGFDLWYSFTTRTDCPGNMFLFDIAEPFSTMIIGVYADCAATEQLFCTSTFDGGNVQIPNLDCNTTYYLRIFDWGGDQNGEGTFNLNEPACDVNGLAVGSVCTSTADFSGNVSFTGNSAIGFTVTDGVNTATGLTAGSYNTVDDFGWAPYTAAQTITVWDESDPTGFACEISAALADPGNCATCFGTPIEGSTCANSDVISGLPFTDLGKDTNCYGDDYDNNSVCGSFFMNGDDYVYSYTPVADECINVSLTNTDTWTGVFVVEGCPSDPSSTCIGQATETGGNPTLLGACLTAGEEYFIVVSTNPAPQTTAFDIEVNALLCILGDVELEATCTSNSSYAVDVTFTGAGSDFTITDGVNSSNVTSGGTYNTITDLGWDASTGGTTITVTDNSQPEGTDGCSTTASLDFPAECACFGVGTAGSTCGDPIFIADLACPFTDNGKNTSCYGDDYTTSACGTSYLGGDDVVYSYTPAADETIDIVLSNTGTWGGIFILDGCPDDATHACVANNGTSAANVSLLGTELIGGTEYFIMLSTWPAPQSLPYDMTISTVADVLVCDLEAGSAIPTCTSLGSSNFDISFTGTSTDYTVSDGTNSASVTAAGTYNTSTDFGWPDYTGPATITVSDNSSGNPCDAGCLATISLATVDCSCFGSIPSNNLCSGAIDVTPITPTTITPEITVNSGTTVCAEPAFDSSVGTACGSGYNTGSAAVWYSVIGHGGDMVVDLCTGAGNGSANYDSELFVFEGACGALLCLAGQDDGAWEETGQDCTGTASGSITLETVAGTQYYIMVTGFGANSQGDFDLGVQFTAPPLCDLDDLVVEAGECASLTAYEVEVSFTGTTASDYTITDGTNSSVVAAAGTYNTVTDLGWPATDGAATITVIDNDLGVNATGCAVSDDIATPQFCLDCFGTSTAGNTCADPDVVSSLPFTATGYTTDCKGDDYDPNGGSTTCGGSYLGGDDYVFSYTPTGDDCINLSLGNGSWAGVTVFDGCPDDPATTCLDFVGMGSGTATVSVENVCLVADTEYFIIVSTWPAPQATSFDLAISKECTVPAISVAGDPVITCFNPTPEFTATVTNTPSTVSWILPDGTEVESGTITVTSAGAYTARAVDDEGGCVTETVVNVTEDLVPATATVADDVIITCNNPTGTVSGSVSEDAVAFEWLDSNGDVLDVQTLEFDVEVTTINTYTLLAYAANGCSSGAIIQVIPVLGVPTAVATGGGMITCDNLEVSLDGSGSSVGVSYAWYTEGGTLVGEGVNVVVGAPGVYVLEATGSNGCSGTDMVEVLQSTDLPVADAGDGGTINCDVSSVTLDASGSAEGVSYEWSLNEEVVSTEAVYETTIPGTYTLTVVDPETGCSNADIVGVSASTDLPIVNAGLDTELTCDNTVAQLFGTSTAFVPEFTWTLNEEFVSSDQFISVNVAGTYTLTVVDLTSGCTASDDIIISENVDGPDLTATGGEISCESPEVTITATADAALIEWSFGDAGVVGEGASLTVSVAGTYSVTASSESGCSSTATVEVTGECEEPVCEISAASLATDSETTVCADDGIDDIVTVDWFGNTGESSALVVTDTELNILAIATQGNSLNFEGAEPGVCLIWQLTWNGELSGAEAGLNAGDLEGCYALSNAIEVTRLTGDACPKECDLIPAEINTGDETTFCVEDGNDDLVNVTLAAGSGEFSAWVITDGDLNILALPAASPFNFEGAGAGTCLIWNVSFDGELTGATVGANAADLAGCFELSNSIAVTRLTGDDCPSTEVVISTTIFIDTNGDGEQGEGEVGIPGVTVSLTDGAGNTYEGTSSGNGSVSITVPEEGDYDFDVSNVPDGFEFSAGSTGSGTIAAAFPATDLQGGAIGLAQAINPCEDFAAIFNAVCNADKQTYNIIMAFQGGNPGSNGYTITNNLTGVTSSTTESTLVIGPFADQSAYSYTIGVVDNPECSSEVFAGVTDCVATAIELIDFSGEAQARGNNLTWSTASEFESKAFVLERSADGQFFTEIARLDAQGQANVVSNYEFLDESATAGTSYYRLSEMDVNGIVTVVAPIVSIDRDRQELTLVGVSPIPAFDQLTIDMISPMATTIEFAIYNSAGQLMLINKQDASEGANSFNLDVNQLPSGLYVIAAFDTDGSMIQKRFLKE